MQVPRSTFYSSAGAFLAAVVVMSGCDDPNPPSPSEIIAEVRAQLNAMGQECKCDNNCYNPMGDLESGDCDDLANAPEITFIHPTTGLQHTITVGCYCSCSSAATGSARLCVWDNEKAANRLDREALPDQEAPNGG